MASLDTILGERTSKLVFEELDGIIECLSYAHMVDHETFATVSKSVEAIKTLMFEEEEDTKVDEEEPPPKKTKYKRPCKWLWKPDPTDVTGLNRQRTCHLHYTTTGECPCPKPLVPNLVQTVDAIELIDVIFYNHDECVVEKFVVTRAYADQMIQLFDWSNKRGWKKQFLKRGTISFNDWKADTVMELLSMLQFSQDGKEDTFRGKFVVRNNMVYVVLCQHNKNRRYKWADGDDKDKKQ